MSDTLQALLQRVSTPANLLVDPAPEGDTLTTIIQAAVTAPDHGALRPWRFISISGDARNKLGEVFCEATLKDNPDADEKELAAIRGKPLRSPLIIAVVAAVKEHPKVSPLEQMLSAGAAAQNLQLAANALGFGSIWLTGPFASDPYVGQTLGLQPEERIVAFIYLGTPSPNASIVKKKIERRPNPADYMINWPG